MSIAPTDAAMFRALAPHLAEKRPDLLQIIPEGTEYETCLQSVADAQGLPIPMNWFHIQELIRSL